jgi:hypothetical protein
MGKVLFAMRHSVFPDPRDLGEDTMSSFLPAGRLEEGFRDLADFS